MHTMNGNKKYFKRNNSLGGVQNKSSAAFSEKSITQVFEEIHKEIIKHFKEEKLLNNFQVKKYLKVISEMRLLSYEHKNMFEKLKSSLTKIYNQNEKSMEKITSVSEHLTNHSKTFSLELDNTEEVVIPKFPFNQSDTETFKSNMLSNKNFIQKTLEGNNVNTKQQNDEIKETKFPYNYNDTESNMFSKIFFRETPYNTSLENRNIITTQQNDEMKELERTFENNVNFDTEKNYHGIKMTNISRSYTPEQINRNTGSNEMYGRRNNSFSIMNIQDGNCENKSSIYSRKTVSDIYPNNMFHNYLEHNKKLSSISNKNIETNDTCIIDSSQQELLMVIDKADFETNKENTNFLDTISFSEINTTNIIENSQERLPKSQQKSVFNNICQLTENISLHDSNISDKQNKLGVYTENLNKMSKNQHNPIKKVQSMANKPSLKYILEEIDKHNKLNMSLNIYKVIYYLKIILKMKLDTYKQKFHAERAKSALIRIYHLNKNTDRSTHSRAINSNVEQFTAHYCLGNISKSNTPIYKTCNQKSPSYNINDETKSVFCGKFNREASKEKLSIASQNYDEKENCLYKKDKNEVEIKSTNNYLIDDSFQKTLIECGTVTKGLSLLPVINNNESKLKENLYNNMHKEDIAIKNHMSSRTQSHAKWQKNNRQAHSSGISRRRNSSNIDYLNELEILIINHFKGDELLENNQLKKHLKAISEMTFRQYKYKYLAEKMKSALIKIYNINESFERWRSWKQNTESNVSIKTSEEPTLPCNTWNKKDVTALTSKDCIFMSPKLDRTLQFENIKTDESNKTKNSTILDGRFKSGTGTIIDESTDFVIGNETGEILDETLQTKAFANSEKKAARQIGQSNTTEHCAIQGKLNARTVNYGGSVSHFPVDNENKEILDEKLKNETDTIIDESTNFVISNETGEILDETLQTKAFANSEKKAGQQIGQSNITEYSAIQEKLNARTVISEGSVLHFPVDDETKECLNKNNSSSVINECFTMRRFASNERCENYISSTQNLQEIFSNYNDDNDMHAHKSKCEDLEENYYFNAGVSIKNDSQKYFKSSSFSDDTCLITKTFRELDIKHHEDNKIYISNENGDKNSSTISHETNHLMNDKTMIIEKNNETEVKELIRKIGKLHDYLENTVRDEMFKASEVITKGSKTYAQVHKYLEYIENTVEKEIDESIKILQKIVVEGNHIKLERINWLESKFNYSNYLQKDWIQCYLNILNKKLKTFDDRFRGMSENDSISDFFQNSINQTLNAAETNKTSRRFAGTFNNDNEIGKSSINSGITTDIPALHWSFYETSWSSKDNFGLDTLNNTPSFSGQNVAKACDSQKHLSLEKSNTERNSPNSLTWMAPSETINIGLKKLTKGKAPFQTLKKTRKVSAKYEQVIKTMILAFERAHKGLTKEGKRNINKPHVQMASTTQESENDARDHQKSPNFNSNVQKHFVSTEEMRDEKTNQKELTSKDKPNYIQVDRQMSSRIAQEIVKDHQNSPNFKSNVQKHLVSTEKEMRDGKANQKELISKEKPNYIQLDGQISSRIAQEIAKDNQKCPNFDSNVQKHLASSEREMKCEVRNLTQLLQKISFDGNNPRLRELQTLSTSYEQKYSETDLVQSYGIQLEKLTSHFKSIFLRGHGRRPNNIRTNEKIENMIKNWKI